MTDSAITGPSGARKRKNDVKDESESEDGFEKMDVDDPVGGTATDSEDERERQQTPDDSADEDSDIDGPAYSQSNGKGNTSAATPDIPPPRELPFAKKKEVAAPVAAAEDSETEDDDDEL
jgi:hypothetical protein